MQKRMYGLTVIFLFLLPVAVSATQPQQTYSKIFLTPFYTALMTNNNNYNYTIAINPPDGLSSVQSAIISFDIYLNPSVNFTAQVNGKPCSTYFFYVSTTYASAGQARVTFDCSNEVNKKGSYVITLRPSGANTGAVTGWLDLTYMNNPIGEITKVGGTEYDVNDGFGKVFLQILDSNKMPISNATCFSSIFYPNSTIKENQSLMTYLQEGLHFEDIIIPNTIGVYMVSAFCTVPNTANSTVWDDFNCASAGACGSGWTSNWVQVSGDCKLFQDASDSPHTLPYHLKDGGAGCVAYRNFSSLPGNNACYVSFWAKAKDLSAAENCTYRYYNGTVQHNLLTLVDGQDDDTYRYYSYEVCNAYGKSGNSQMGVNFIGDKCFLDDVNVTIINNYNSTEYQILRGSGELHITNRFSNITANINQTQLNNIFGNLSDIKNYLIIINGTIYQINQSQYSNYNSLLSAINSVNSTANYNSYLLREVNQSVFNLSIAQTGYFQQVLAYLNDINYSLNTTIEYKLDLINGTVFQINNSQLTYYTNLLAAINSVNNSVNNINFSSILSYLIVINGTTQQINSSQFLYYSNLLNSISSVNDTQNSNYINLYNLLLEINQTGNITLEFVASINQSLLTYYSSLYNSIISLNDTQNQHFMDIMEFLASINFSINTTMEYKLDLINQTVFQINDTLSNQNFTVDFSQVLAAISQVNTTANQNQQYLIEINGTLYQLNQSEAQHFIQIMQAISDLNLTMNTTLLGYLIGINNTTNQINNTLIIINGNILSLNSSLYQYYQDIYVILKDINFTTNTTLENKLDFINSTTWQNYLILQNLTIGNVSVSADVNWTQGYLETTFLTFSDQINGEGIELLTETVTCLTNTTLQHWLNGTKCIQGVCHAYNETLVELCNYGCSNNICLPQPTIQYGFALGFALIAIGGIYMAYRGFGRR